MAAAEPKTIRPDEHPELTPDRNVEAGVADTFPASDPVATTASQGARAVPADEMLRAADAPAPVPRDAVTLTQSFPDGEAAKLALETLVREGPLDRRSAQVRAESGDSGPTLEIQVPRADAERIGALLRKQAGAAG